MTPALPSLPGMPPLQLSLASTATSAAKGGDGAFGGATKGITSGDWNVNYGAGSIAPASNPLMLCALAVGAWFLFKKKA